MTIPYLHAEADETEAWCALLDRKSGLRVALVWRGRNYFSFDDPRALPLETLRPVLDSGTHIVTLMRDVSEDEKGIFAAYENVTQVGEELGDFADIAAVVDGLDLIITVDTSFAHLADAMCKLTWVMHRFAGDWRWLLDRSDSPWYPAVRLFRQLTPGDWAEVVAELARGLGHLMAKKPVL